MPNFTMAYSPLIYTFTTDYQHFLKIFCRTNLVN